MPATTSTPTDDPKPCPDCGQPHADEGDASSWPAWTDAYVYNLAPKARQMKGASR